MSAPKSDDFAQRAGHAFALAFDLARELREIMDHNRRSIGIVPGRTEEGFTDFPTKFQELWSCLVDLTDDVQALDENDKVAKQLKRLMKLVRNIRKSLETTGDCWDYFPDLNTVATDGFEALKQHSESNEDPFTFLDERVVRSQVDIDANDTAT